MGWKGKLVGKVGNYLSQSLEVPLRHLYNYAAPPRTQESSQHYVNSQGLQHANETAESFEEDYGPDTSSLTAFLYSLLSSSNGSSRRCDDSPEASEAEPDSNAGPSTPGSWERHNFGEYIEGVERRIHPLDVQDSGKATCNSFNSRLHSALQPASPTSTASKLPPMSDSSLLLSESFRAFMYAAMPILVRDRHWILLYSTAKHGISLRTLYRKSAALAEPFLLVVGDFHGVTFGGLLTAALKPTSKRKYLGNNDMFVFTNVNQSPQIFKATGANRYYLLCMNDAISLGGGGHFALHLDEDLLNGSSGACDTFGNSCLATSTDFSVANVELWGFAHATMRHA